MPQPTLLVVEDDRGIGEALVGALQPDYQITLCRTGHQALNNHSVGSFSLIIIDLNLPDASGEHLCRKLLKRGVKAPILILTAEASVLSKIKLLDMGASDYLTKPFSLGELKARLRVLLRTTDFLSNGAILSVGDLILDSGRYSVTRAGQEVHLRRKEFIILECLMHNAGLIVSRQKLSRYGWPNSDKLWTNSLDVHIKNLRDKIDRPFEQPMIKTIHGLGYKLEAEPASRKIEPTHELAHA